MRSRGRSAQPKNDTATSWGPVAEWYAEHLSGDDTYHAKVVIPNTLRVVKPGKGKRILDLACGEGVLTRLISESGAQTIGADIAPELIAFAKEKGGGADYYVAPGHDLDFAADESFDTVVCVLAIQNMERPEKTIDETARVLKRGGRLVIVINHPVVRVPKRSSWGFDEKTKKQYRRLDGYYLPSKEKMLAHPGQGEAGGYTWTFHRPLEGYAKLLFNRGFVMTALEEWISHRVSEKGPRKAAEDAARKEFPLFMMIEATKRGI